jgi:hypothetical protein
LPRRPEYSTRRAVDSCFLSFFGVDAEHRPLDEKGGGVSWTDCECDADISWRLELNYQRKVAFRLDAAQFPMARDRLRFEPHTAAAPTSGSGE